jgi:predicted permease
MWAATNTEMMPMDTLRQDLRETWRSLRRSPGFLVVALASLALGIGANSTVFSLVSAVQFRPLPYRDVERLVDLHELNPTDLCAGCSVGTSYATFADWKERAASYQGMGAWVEDVFAVSATDAAVRVQGAYVSAELFPVLGVAPALGRPIAPDEDRIGGAPVVLLGHEVWQTQFGGDTSLIGRLIRVNGLPREVVGIMPPRFGFPEFADIWLPIGPTAALRARDDRSLGVVARLRSGTSVAQARTELAGIMRGVAAEHPGTMRNWSAGVATLRSDLTDESGPPFFLLLGAAGFVLLIACANLANLLLARALRRERDFAVRVALGASRTRVARQLLTESLVLSLTGGALGLLVALWGVDATVGLIPSDIPFWIDIRVDWRVVLFTLLTSIATGLAFGMLPALRAGRREVSDVLKAGARQVSASHSRGRLRSALVVSEMAMAVVLLAGTGLLIKTYLRVSRIDNLGYDPRGVLRASAEFLDARYADSAQRALFGASVLEHVAGTAGVEQAALESTRFLGTFVGTESSLMLEGAAAPVPDNVAPRFAWSVTPAYFDLLRIPLRRGRGFTAADRPGAPLVAIVNEAAAAVLWPGQNPLGKRFRIGRPGDAAEWMTVVGVVASTIGSPLGRRGAVPYVYTSFPQQPPSSLTILLRTTGNPLMFADNLREAVAAADRDLPLDDVRTLEAFLADWIRPVTFFTRAMGALAAIALAIATVGIYGVMSYAVSQRTHEIGVRVALGATAHRVVRLVLGQTALLGVLGALIGLTAALALTGALRQVLFGTSPNDPVVLAAVTAVLMAVALLASLVPVRRALRVNPVEALRAE